MTSIPSTLYTKNRDFTLAYQVTGSGRDDLIYLLFETPNVVANWFIPEHVRFLERLASFSRLVITDRRGMGCSDRLAPGTSPVLEELVDDLLVVMETANAFSATLRREATRDVDDGHGRLLHRIELRARDYITGEIGPSKWIGGGRLMMVTASHG